MEINEINPVLPDEAQSPPAQTSLRDIRDQLKLPLSELEEDDDEADERDGKKSAKHKKTKAKKSKTVPAAVPLWQEPSPAPASDPAAYDGMQTVWYPQTAQEDAAQWGQAGDAAYGAEQYLSDNGASAGQYDSSYEGQYDSSYAGQYDSSYAGQYDPSYAEEYDSSYAGQYDSSYAGQYDPSYAGQYDPSYAGQYDSSYTGQYDSSYAGQYDSSYAGQYDPAYAGQYDPAAATQFAPASDAGWGAQADASDAGAAAVVMPAGEAENAVSPSDASDAQGNVFFGPAAPADPAASYGSDPVDAASAQEEPYAASPSAGTPLPQAARPGRADYLDRASAEYVPPQTRPKFELLFGENTFLAVMSLVSSAVCVLWSIIYFFLLAQRSSIFTQTILQMEMEGRENYTAQFDSPMLGVLKVVLYLIPVIALIWMFAVVHAEKKEQYLGKSKIIFAVIAVFFLIGAIAIFDLGKAGLVFDVMKF